MHHAPVKRRDAERCREVSAGASPSLARERRSHCQPQHKLGGQRRKSLGSQCEPCASPPDEKGSGWRGGSCTGMLHPANVPAEPRIAHSIPQMLPIALGNLPSSYPPTSLLDQGPTCSIPRMPQLEQGPPHPPITPCLTWDCPTPYPKISRAGCLIPPNTLQGTRNPHPLFIPRNLGAFRDFQAREQRGGGTAKRRAVTLLKGTEALCHRGLKYVESKNCWPRSQGGDRNLAEDPGEQSKNRKMHRQA